MADVTRRRWTGPAGTTLSFLTAGTGDAVVLLHGIPTGAELWRELLPRVAEAGYRGLAPDLPGYGQTRLPADADHSLAGAAATVAAWLRDADLAPAWIVGHDAGAAVAQILAVDFPDTVGRMTLTNAVVDGAWPAWRARIGILGARLGCYRPAAALRLVPNPYMRFAIRRAFADPSALSDQDAGRVLWDSKVTDPSGRIRFQRHLAALTPQDTAAAAARLPAVEVPCQLVWGDADPYQPWATAGRRLHDLLPHAAVTRVATCGHFTPLECPQVLLDAMLAWHNGTAA